MPNSKTYLNVPYAQKDTVKGLGAKWDAVRKKWYIPADIDIALFAKWQTEIIGLESSSAAITKAKSQASSSKNRSSANYATVGVITNAKDKNFVAYNGHEPPWD